VKRRIKAVPKSKWKCQVYFTNIIICREKDYISKWLLKFKYNVDGPMAIFIKPFEKHQALLGIM
jgi:hypothetical protein